MLGGFPNSAGLLLGGAGGVAGEMAEANLNVQSDCTAPTGRIQEQRRRIRPWPNSREPLPSAAVDRMLRAEEETDLHSASSIRLVTPNAMPPSSTTILYSVD